MDVIKLIEKETAVLNENGGRMKKSPYRMAYHIMPPGSWMNDPNGLVYYKGYYHVFYQFHPYDVVTGWMHWGHVRSKDLIHWERLPIALRPTDEYDRDGCFSGSAIEIDGKLALVYTGNIFIDREKDRVEENQSVAFSEDGVHFTKYENNPVIKSHPLEGSGHFRDPKVWKRGSFYYMIVGTRKENVGKVVLYKSNDLLSWDYVGVMLESEGNQGYMWECPDYFELDGRGVLIMSPQGIEPEGSMYLNEHQTVYIVGELNYDTGKFTYERFEELDKGFDFYAAQTMHDEQGRRIVIGWMDMWGTEMPTQKEGWSGALTLPRELIFTSQGTLLMKPVEELKGLRQRENVYEWSYIREEELVTNVKGDVMELDVTLEYNSVVESTFGIKVGCNECGTEETVIEFDTATSTILLDRSKSGLALTGKRTAKLTFKQCLVVMETLGLLLNV
ncbi:glycoside hydrolase family 32 protein [Bacillus coahuilensis]|uniref:glycoside hydrolase family 32 protein n=1 Tax=Bacillus coahuilensis TaxID=408580 RepID=UPI000AB14CA3|nr:glycoside hydrolase family 32 protein [Bacillus coahuilensis]